MTPDSPENVMPRQDSVDFLSAFAVGAVLGIGATLLLQPKRTPKERIAKQWKPYRKQMGKSYKHARTAMRGGADATSEMTAALVDAGQELLGEFRDEAAKILAETRTELQKLYEEQSKDLSKNVRRTRKRFGV
jgi:gas vesicle protein